MRRSHARSLSARTMNPSLHLPGRCASAPAHGRHSRPSLRISSPQFPCQRTAGYAGRRHLALPPPALGTLGGLALFFSPTVGALAYATVLGKGNTKDGLSRLLTQVSQVRKGGREKGMHTAS